MELLIDIPANDSQKGTLLKMLAKENDMVLSQSYLYAKNLCEYGVDIAEKWTTVTLQAEALEKAYRKGRYDEAERWANRQKEYEDQQKEIINARVYKENEIESEEE